MSSSKPKGWKVGLVWVWISSIPRHIVYGILRSITYLLQSNRTNLVDSFRNFGVKILNLTWLQWCSHNWSYGNSVNSFYRTSSYNPARCHASHRQSLRCGSDSFPWILEDSVLMGHALLKEYKVHTVEKEIRGRDVPLGVPKICKYKFWA